MRIEIYVKICYYMRFKTLKVLWRYATLFLNPFRAQPFKIFFVSQEQLELGQISKRPTLNLI